MAEKMIITNAGLQEMENELHHLKVVTRKEIAQKIKEAREQGDLSENAEYDAAMDEQRDIEARIKELEKMLKNVEVVDETEIDLGTVNVGCTVKVLDVEFNEEIEYKLVGSKEADILKNKISNEAPIGRALIGAKVDDIVDVEAPDGIFQYKVLDIQRTK
jgi:transcription elongation factor GreA